MGIRLTGKLSHAFGAFARTDDRRTSVNAIWVMTHLPETDAEMAVGAPQSGKTGVKIAIKINLFSYSYIVLIVNFLTIGIVILDISATIFSVRAIS